MISNPSSKSKPPRKRMSPETESIKSSVPNTLSRSETLPPPPVPSKKRSFEVKTNKSLYRTHSDPFPQRATSLSRTRSGLPICTTCHAAAGTCQHTSMAFLPKVSSWRARQARMKFKRKLSSVEAIEPIFPKPSAPTKKAKKEAVPEEENNTSEEKEDQVSESADLMTPSPGNNIVLNVAKKPCIACWEVEDMVVDFRCDSAPTEVKISDDDSRNGSPVKEDSIPATETHVACQDCFITHATIKIKDRKLKLCPERGIYTIPCPMECPASFVKLATFDKLLCKELVEKYHRFCALKYAEDVHVIWCPYDDCFQGAIPNSGEKVRLRQAALATNSQPTSPRGAGYSTLHSPKSGHNVLISGVSILGVIQEEQGSQREHQPQITRLESEIEHFVTCNSCERPVCMDCHKGHGPEISCADFQKKATEGMIIDTNSKACPGCGVVIYKDGGCNHMTCLACGHQFCWIHLTPWVEGGACQRDHWATTTGMTTVYNTKRVVLNSLSGAWANCAVM